MKIKFFLRMIFYSLLRRRMRMLIALIAVAVGATIISGMVTVWREVPQQLGREFRAYGANLLIIPSGEAATFNQEKISEVREILSGQEVVGAAPFLYERLEINKQYILTGGTDFAELQRVSPYWQIEGAYPVAGEREVLIGAEVAKTFSPYEPNEIIGQEVTISAGEGTAMKKYVVSGIVSTGGKEEDFAFMNLTDLQQIVDKPAQVSIVQFSVVAEGDNLNSIVEKISGGADGIQPQLVQQIANSEFNVLSKLQVLVLIVTAVVLILTLICVTTTMMAVVTERRKEIGLKKALGASNENIVREFLGEGCLLGAFGGLFGSGLGYLFAQSVSVQVFGRGIYFSVSIAILSIVLSIIVTSTRRLSCEVNKLALLELKNVSMVYNGKVRALDGINFSVEKGEWVAIMGPSGSGKTTLMNIIGCMDKATGGEVILDGIDLSDVDSQKLTEIRREKIGMVFQQFHLVPYLTAVENIMVAQYYHGLPDLNDAMTELKRVGLEDRANHLPSQLSGGEQQRVCIARALINYPVLILADEPTGNLDEANQNTVTHSPDVGKEAQRCIVLEHGRIKSN